MVVSVHKIHKHLYHILSLAIAVYNTLRVYWSLFFVNYLYYYLHWLTWTCRFPKKDLRTCNFFCILNLAVQQSITMWHWSPWDALPSICSVKLVLIRRRWQNRWNHTTNERCVVAFVASETSEHCTQHFSANKSHRFQDLIRSRGKWDIKAKQSALLSYKDLQRLCIFVNLSFALQTDSIVLKRSETQKLRFSNLHFVIVWSVSTWCQLGCSHLPRLLQEEVASFWEWSRGGSC